jgi:hypothetical protein
MTEDEFGGLMGLLRMRDEDNAKLRADNMDLEAKLRGVRAELGLAKGEVERLKEGNSPILNKQLLKKMWKKVSNENINCCCKTLEDFELIICARCQLEKLQQENQRLRKALEDIESGRVYFDGKPGKTPKTRARATLEVENE